MAHNRFQLEREVRTFITLINPKSNTKDALSDSVLQDAVNHNQLLQSMKKHLTAEHALIDMDSQSIFTTACVHGDKDMVMFLVKDLLKLLKKPEKIEASKNQHLINGLAYIMLRRDFTPEEKFEITKIIFEFPITSLILSPRLNQIPKNPCKHYSRDQYLIPTTLLNLITRIMMNGGNKFHKDHLIWIVEKTNGLDFSVRDSTSLLPISHIVFMNRYLNPNLIMPHTYFATLLKHSSLPKLTEHCTDNHSTPIYPPIALTYNPYSSLIKNALSEKRKDAFALLVQLYSQTAWQNHYLPAEIITIILKHVAHPLMGLYKENNLINKRTQSLLTQSNSTDLDEEIINRVKLVAEYKNAGHYTSSILSLTRQTIQFYEKNSWNGSVESKNLMCSLRESLQLYDDDNITHQMALKKITISIQDYLSSTRFKVNNPSLATSALIQHSLITQKTAYEIAQARKTIQNNIIQNDPIIKDWTGEDDLTIIGDANNHLSDEYKVAFKTY